MEVQMIQIDLFDATLSQTVTQGYIVISQIVSIIHTLTGGSQILLQGGHTLESPIPADVLVKHIYTALEQLYGGEHRKVKTESKEEE